MLPKINLFAYSTTRPVAGLSGNLKLEQDMPEQMVMMRTRIRVLKEDAENKILFRPFISMQ